MFQTGMLEVRFVVQIDTTFEDIRHLRDSSLAFIQYL